MCDLDIKLSLNYQNHLRQQRVRGTYILICTQSAYRFQGVLRVQSVNYNCFYIINKSPAKQRFRTL